MIQNGIVNFQRILKRYFWKRIETKFQEPPQASDSVFGSEAGSERRTK